MKNAQDDTYELQIRKITSELEYRQNAAKRLHSCDFWIQIISIYYSCFTAVISIWSLDKKAGFLTMPSAILTVLVAIVVTFANAQKCSSRAMDLEANCRDLAITLIYLKTVNDDAALLDMLGECYKKFGDSESSSIIDRWKSENKILYNAYLFFMCILIAIFFIAPFVIIRFWGDFSDYMSSVHTSSDPCLFLLFKRR